MSRYEAMFDRLSRHDELAIGAFVMLGDPDVRLSETLLDELVAGGADMLEVGIPFSDPIADGPVIQAAARRALSAGVRVGDCFQLIARCRARHPGMPIGILTYANLVQASGRKNFCESAAAAGADSLLVADVPSSEAEPWVVDIRTAGLDPVMIAAANTPDKALARIAALGGGYTYCVTRAGVTGDKGGAAFDRRLVDRLAQLSAPPPIFGFGISSAAQVRAARASGAAGVICGSVIVQSAADGGDVRRLVADLKQATRNDFALQ